MKPKSKTLTNIVNFGCSFAYGNQADSFNHLSGIHKSMAFWFAEKFGLNETNLARPGNSNDGIIDNILHWLSITDKETINKSLLLVGWSSGLRFGFISDTVQVSNKARPGKIQNENAQNAFILGPENQYRYMIEKWSGKWVERNINFDETARLSLYRNIAFLYSLQKNYNLAVIQYHALSPPQFPYDDEVMIYEPLNDMRKMLNGDKFYKFESKSLQWHANLNPDKYYISKEDSHPNHICYSEWANKMFTWMEDNDYWNLKFPNQL